MHPIFGNNPGRVTDAVAAFANRQPPTTYRDLVIETRAYREQGQIRKALLTYDQSLTGLQRAGFDRHLRIDEACALLCDGLEGKLTGQHNEVFDDTMIDYHEWLSLAIKRKGDIFVVYTDPVGLQWDKSASRYNVQGKLLYTKRKEYDIAGKGSEEWIDLEQFSPDFVQDFYSRPFAALPEEMRFGTRARMSLPLDDNIWPVACGSFDGFSIGYVGDLASRGVRSAKKNFHRK
jgi:hypothetical protein